MNHHSFCPLPHCCPPSIPGSPPQSVNASISPCWPPSCPRKTPCTLAVSQGLLIIRNEKKRYLPITATILVSQPTVSPPGAINTTYCISISSCVYHPIPVSINIHPFIHRITLHSLPNPIRPPGSFISNHSQHNKVLTACLQSPLWVVYLPLSGNTSY